MSSIASYLQPGRLSDVLALIQVLSYDRDSYRSEKGLDLEFQRKPQSVPTWMDLGRQHPEFFRVRNDPTKEPRVALLARYVLDRETLPDGEEKRPPLDPPIANKLMELAIELHDKQLERKNHWKTTILPMAIAIIAASASIGAAIISSSKATPQVLQVVAQPIIPPDLAHKAAQGR